MRTSLLVFLDGMLYGACSRLIAEWAIVVYGLSFPDLAAFLLIIGGLMSGLFNLLALPKSQHEKDNEFYRSCISSQFVCGVCVSLGGGHWILPLLAQEWMVDLGTHPIVVSSFGLLSLILPQYLLKSIQRSDPRLLKR